MVGRVVNQTGDIKVGQWRTTQLPIKWFQHKTVRINPTTHQIKIWTSPHKWVFLPITKSISNMSHYFCRLIEAVTSRSHQGRRLVVVNDTFRLSVGWRPLIVGKINANLCLLSFSDLQNTGTVIHMTFIHNKHGGWITPDTWPKYLGRLNL